MSGMDANFIGHYTRKCVQAEKEIARLEAQLQMIQSGNFDPNHESITDKEFIALANENKKLKYRIGILTRSIEERESQSRDSGSYSLSNGGHMCNILGHLKDLFASAVRTAFPNVPEPVVDIQLSKVADYQCNAAMVLAKALKTNPRIVAQAVVDNLKKSLLVSSVELSGPGFINIMLCKDFIRKQITGLVTCGVVPPPAPKKRVVVDFSSPNIAKEMHVGHLRSTIIGDSLCRLLEYLGHDVLRLNHLGDWGTQFGMLIAHLKDKFPDFAAKPPPIADLQGFYKESKKRFDEDGDFKQKAYEAVVKLQAHEEEHMRGWQQICDISYKEFTKVYDRLGVKITPRGESFYQKHMEALVSELDASNYLSLEEGRKVMYAEGADIPLTMVKSDGGFTYDTSDMACIKQRIEEEKGDWLIYITDAGQAQHFKSILACARRCGICNPQIVRVDHVTFGVVLGEDKKKFKTRSGDTVRLRDLLDEGIQRSEEKLREKERDKVLTPEEFTLAKEAVAYGCIKYADLCHDRTRDYVFSFDRMLDFRGNTAAYLLYALTRIRSIARTAGVSREELLKESSTGPISLDHEKEWKLARTLLKLGDVLLKLADDLYIHPLCEFLYEVSTVFSEFYDNCYCVEKDGSGNIVKINMNRLLLCEATATVMQKCFDILGITTVEKM